MNGNSIKNKRTITYLIEKIINRVINKIQETILVVSFILILNLSLKNSSTLLKLLSKDLNDISSFTISENKLSTASVKR